MTFSGIRLPVLLLILLAFPLLWLLWLGIYAISPGPLFGAEEVAVVIPPRTGVSGIEKILAENKIIRDDPRFAMLAVLTGAATKLRAGEYAFIPGESPLGVIELLKSGRVLYRPVTIPEGTEMAGVAGILAAEGWVDRQHFLDLAHDPEVLAESGVEGQSLEGYLFPDTYYLSKGQQDEAGIIRMMVKKHFKVYEEIERNHGDSRMVQLGHRRIVILASIVEKETGNPEEQKLVASVFLNRLAKGMRLQADPTVRYGRGEDTGPLTREDLKEPTPYNTYIIPGLPPGPISNPGRTAIEAALFPAETDYLYFVSKDDSSHYFSRTLPEHNRAVGRYRSGK